MVEGGSPSPSRCRARPLELAIRREDPGAVNVPPSSGVGERLVALAGQRPWWPLVEPTPRWIRVRIGGELVADSHRALLHVQYGPGALPRSFLPAYYVPVDDVMPAALVDPMEAEAGLTVWAVAAGGLRADDAAWMHHRPPQPLEALVGMVTFSWRDPLAWFEEEEPLLAHARDPHKRVDVVASSRAVRVELGGVLLAESQRPLLLFETTLPVRYYLPPGDVRSSWCPARRDRPARTRAWPRGGRRGSGTGWPGTSPGAIPRRSRRTRASQDWSASATSGST